jgi:transposase
LDQQAKCGIDVSAKELVAGLRRNGQGEAERRFANTAAGHKELKRWLTRAARRIHALTETATREKNRLHALSVTDTRVKIIVSELKRSLPCIARSQARLMGEARKLIAADALLARRFQLLLSLPGVGETSARQLLGELALVPADAEVRQWVAYAGLDPRECSSGSSLHQRPHISKVGNGHLRRALYVPALTTAPHDLAFAAYFAAYYEALQQRGKCKMVARVAVMRNLLHAAFGMFKHDARFDGSRVFRPTVASAGAAAQLCAREDFFSLPQRFCF